MAAGALLGLHELALEDTREFNQRPKLDRYPDHVLLVYWSARVDQEPQLGIELVKVHLHIYSGRSLFTVHGVGLCARLDELHDVLEGRRGNRVRGLHPLSCSRRPDRRALPGRGITSRCRIGRARGRGAGRHRQARARARSTGSSRRYSFSSAGSCRSATSSARRRRPSSGLPASRRGSREYLRDIGDHLAQIGEQTIPPVRRPHRADDDLLQREPEPPQRAGDAAHGARRRSS